MVAALVYLTLDPPEPGPGYDVSAVPLSEAFPLYLSLKPCKCGDEALF